MSLSALSDSVKACGAEALSLLGLMREQEALAATDSSKLRTALEDILATAEVWTHLCSVTLGFLAKGQKIKMGHRLIIIA